MGMCEATKPDDDELVSVAKSYLSMNLSKTFSSETANDAGTYIFLSARTRLSASNLVWVYSAISRRLAGLPSAPPRATRSAGAILPVPFAASTAHWCRHLEQTRNRALDWR